jgi:hypothetical protein
MHTSPLLTRAGRMRFFLVSKRWLLFATKILRRTPREVRLSFRYCAFLCARLDSNQLDYRTAERICQVEYKA